MSPQVKASLDASIVTWIANLPEGGPRVGPGAAIAAYVPVGSEPGTTAMLEVLREGGFRVLLPKVAAGPPAPLRWAWYDGPESLHEGRFGLLEPSGDSASPDALGDAALILVPALSVDRHGIRLGRGAGYYDRSIPEVDTNKLVAVVFDDELVDELPSDDFDVPMGWSLTPGEGFRRLGTS
ncbi:5-formyltetrahydrofolate cyclo-ligase [Williamsia sp. DF01-3]|nr:5-formyltetrahydrofolate cyclo-ligase [Williamsia sp. DF01-3]